MTGVVNGILQSLVSSMSPVANQAANHYGRVLTQHGARIGYHGLKHAINPQTTNVVMSGFTSLGTGVVNVLTVIVRESAEAATKAVIRSATRRA